MFNLTGFKSFFVLCRIDEPVCFYEIRRLWPQEVSMVSESTYQPCSICLNSVNLLVLRHRRFHINFLMMLSLL